MSGLSRQKKERGGPLWHLHRRPGRTEKGAEKDALPMLIKLLWIALAGAAGTLARYGLAGAVQRLAGGAFPWGTFAVNILGSFLFGVVWSAATERNLLSADVRLVILTGFMGAFTTFSTLMFESGKLIEDGQWLLLGGNIVGSVLVGLGALFLGLALGRML